MKADYYCRDTVPKLLKQMFNIGLYLPDVMGDGSLNVRHFAPFIFYMTVLALALIGSAYGPFSILAMVMFGGYIGVITIDTILRTSQRKNLTFLLNIFLIPMMHLSYAVGTLVGLLKKTIRI